MLEFNKKGITDKVTKFTKIFQENLKSIERNVAKNQENVLGIRKEIEKLTGTINMPLEEKNIEIAQETQKEEISQSQVKTQPKNKKKKK